MGSDSELHRRFKFALAKELIDMGYRVGTEVRTEDGHFIDVQGVKGDEVVNVEVWKTNLPPWIIVRVKEHKRVIIDKEVKVEIRSKTYNDGYIETEDNEEQTQYKKELYNRI